MLYYCYRIGIWIACRGSWNWAYRLAGIYAFFWNLFDNRRKQIIQKHLEGIFKSQGKEVTPAEIKHLTYSTLQNFAKYLIEVFRLPLIDSAFIQKRVSITYEKDINQIINSNKGLIIFTLHICNWELAGIAMKEFGFPLTTVVLLHKDPRINDLFQQRRSGNKMAVIPLDIQAGKKSLQVLKDGKILALVGDENYSKNKDAVKLEFLGEIMELPPGPAALSRASGAPVVPGLMVRQKDNSFQLYLGKAVYPLRTHNAREDIQQLTITYLEALKPYLIQYPDQWFRFQ